MTRIDRIIEKMTAEQKIAQMLMPAFRYYRDEKGLFCGVTEMRPDMKRMFEKYCFAGTMLFAQNADDTESTVRLTSAIRRANASVPGRPGLFIAADQEGGSVTRLGHGTQTPGNMALGAANDEKITFQAARILARELSAVGINYDAAPVLDVNNDPRNPVIGVRSFADDPEDAARLGVSFMKGIMSEGVISTLKHFPGHGDTATDSHTGLPCVDKTLEELSSFELIPFARCITSGAEAVMTAHIQYPRVENKTYRSVMTGKDIFLPATLSKTIITDVLRKKLGFSGVVVTDSMGMDAISKHFDPIDAAEMAINAGVDILLMPSLLSTPKEMDDFCEYIKKVASLLESGRIKSETVDAALHRILALKEAHGLLEPATYDKDAEDAAVKKALDIVGSAENHAAEMKIAEKALVLIKNDGALPIKDEADVLVVPYYESAVKSAEYAVRTLTDEGKLKKDAAVRVAALENADAKQLCALAAKCRHLVVISALYRLSGLSPDDPLNKKADALIAAAKASGADVTVICAQLPYDAARFSTADAVIAAWGARGMSEDPRNAANGAASYGPNIPAAVRAALDPEASFSGTLPVDIPVIEDGAFSKKVLYPRRSGVIMKNGKSGK